MIWSLSISVIVKSQRFLLLTLLLGCCLVGCTSKSNTPSSNNSEVKDSEQDKKNVPKKQENDGTSKKQQNDETTKKQENDQPLTKQLTEMTSYVPADAAIVAVTRPKRLLASSAFSNIPFQAKLEEFQYSSRNYAGSLTRLFWLRMIGKQITDVEQAIYVLDINEPTNIASTLSDAYILRFTTPLDQNAVLGALYQYEDLEYAGKKYWGRKNNEDALAAFMPNNLTLIVGQQLIVKQMLLAEANKKTILM